MSATKNGHLLPLISRLMSEEAPQREHSLREEVFNGLRWLVRSGASPRMMPHDLPTKGSRITAKIEEASIGGG